MLCSLVFLMICTGLIYSTTAVMFRHVLKRKAATSGDGTGAGGGGGGNEPMSPQEVNAMRRDRIQQQRRNRERNLVKPAVDGMRVVGAIGDVETFSQLGLVPGVRDSPFAPVPAAVMCEATTRFQPPFFNANRDGNGDTNDGGAKLRFGDLRGAMSKLVNLTVCSNEPTSSYDPVATDVTDHFFDSGAAEALADDFTSQLYDVFASPSEREEGKPGGFRGRLGFRRREAQGSRDTECQIVVMPLPSTAITSERDLHPCRTHDHYAVADIARKFPRPGPRSGLVPKTAAPAKNAASSTKAKPVKPAGAASLRTFEHEADRSVRLGLEGEYELTVTPTQVLVRIRHLSGLRHALTTALQMALHTGHIEHRGREADRAVAESLAQASANATSSASSNEVQKKLAIARGSRAPVSLIIPSVWIFDGPSSGWRGMQLDVARHFHDVAELKEVIRSLARRKMNRLQLHLTDDQGWRIDSALFPSLPAIGGKRGPSLNGARQPKHKASLPYADPKYYTAAEIRELSDYAAVRGVALVPEVDLPAHASALVIAFQRDVGLHEPRTFATRYGKTRNTATNFKPRESPTSNGEDDNALSRWISSETGLEASGLSAKAERSASIHRLLSDDIVPALDKLRRRRSASSQAADAEDSATGYRYGVIRKMNDDCAAFAITAKPGDSDSLGAPNCMGGSHGIIYPDDDGLLLAKAVLAEVAAVFDRSEYIHVGGDQAERIRDDAWAQWMRGDAPDYIKAANPEAAAVAAGGGGEFPARTGAQLQAHFMDALIVFVRGSLRRRPVVWDDTLMESGPHYNAPYGTIVAVWREDTVSWAGLSQHASNRPGTDAAGLRTSAADEAAVDAPIAKAPVAFVFMGKTRLYLDYMQYLPASSNRGPADQQQKTPPWAKHKAVTLKRTYDSRLAIPPPSLDGPAVAAAALPRNVAVVGTQGCLWSELVRDATQLRFQLFPRLYAVADAAWSGQRVGSLVVPGGPGPLALCVESGGTGEDECRRVGGVFSAWDQVISLALKTPTATIAGKRKSSSTTATAGNTYFQRVAAFMQLLGRGLPDTPEADASERG